MWDIDFCLPFYRGELRDSNTAYWTSHEWIAKSRPQGEMRDLFGICCITPHAQWSGLNHAFIAEPVDDLADLRRRIERAADFYRRRKLGWTLVICEEWIAPHLRSAVAPLCREMSLGFGIETTGMRGRMDEEAPPRELEIRRVSTPQMRREFADINAEGWNVPVEWAREVLENDRFWSGCVAGFIGYVGGEPASVAMAQPVEGTAYLSWGATRPAHRRKGYFEALVRTAAGNKEAQFVATPNSARILARRGFQTVAKFTLYVSEPKISEGKTS